MIKSMTGFGRHEVAVCDYKISVEVKSVNHRYCDLNIKLPKKFNACENDIRNIVKKYAARGKIDVFINFESYTEKMYAVKYNSGIAKGYMQAVTAASEEFLIEKAVTASQLIRFPDVISLEEKETDDEELYRALEDAVSKACVQFAESRQKEGINLKNDVLTKLDYIFKTVELIENQSPHALSEYRRKLNDKVAELLGDVDIDERILATEMAVFADKICTDEEIVRLKSHVLNMKDTFEKDEAVGRKLDFIAQEMNREANTILSKSNDLNISNMAIDLKTEIEKVREQIQNIE